MRVLSHSCHATKGKERCSRHISLVAPVVVRNLHVSNIDTSLPTVSFLPFVSTCVGEMLIIQLYPFNHQFWVGTVNSCLSHVFFPDDGI